MTEQDREKWNSKYLKNNGNSDPSEILERYISLVSHGNALDLACGNGRNSKLLAQKGLKPGGILIFESFIDKKKE